MPAISVFNLAQRIKEHVCKEHESWIIDTILVFYSTRSKPTKFGYKVAPLYIGVIAKDIKENRATNCRIQFDELCKIITTLGWKNIIPYISVSTGTKEHRAIFDTGVTYLKIECHKTGSFNGHPYIRHHTERLDNKPHFDRLNETVLQNIKDRLESNHNADMKDLQTQFNDLISFDDCEADINSMDYGLDNVEGGYRD